MWVSKVVIASFYENGAIRDVIIQILFLISTSNANVQYLEKKTGNNTASDESWVRSDYCIMQLRIA